MSPDSISRRLHIIAILKFAELWKDTSASSFVPSVATTILDSLLSREGNFCRFFRVFLNCLKLSMSICFEGIISKDWKEFYRRDWLIFPFFLRLYECLQNFADILELFLRKLRQKFSSLTDLRISFLIFPLKITIWGYFRSMKSKQNQFLYVRRKRIFFSFKSFHIESLSDE